MVRPGVREISPVSIYSEVYGGKDLRKRCVLSGVDETPNQIMTTMTSHQDELFVKIFAAIILLVVLTFEFPYSLSARRWQFEMMKRWMFFGCFFSLCEDSYVFNCILQFYR